MRILAVCFAAFALFVAAPSQTRVPSSLIGPGFLRDTGTINSYAVPLASAPADGQQILFFPATSNNGPSTLTAGGVTATIETMQLLSLTTPGTMRAEVPAMLVWNARRGTFQLLNAAVVTQQSIAFGTGLVQTWTVNPPEVDMDQFYLETTQGTNRPSGGQDFSSSTFFSPPSVPSDPAICSPPNVVFNTGTSSLHLGELSDAWYDLGRGSAVK